MAPRVLHDAAKAEEVLNRTSSPEFIETAEPLEAERSSTGVSMRMSAPLLAKLDALAAEQHRTRSNLIQHILWEFVRKVRP